MYLFLSILILIDKIYCGNNLFLYFEHFSLNILLVLSIYILQLHNYTNEMIPFEKDAIKYLQERRKLQHHLLILYSDPLHQTQVRRKCYSK